MRNDQKSDYNNRMIYSEDGINWTEIANDDRLYDLFDGSNGDPNSIAYGNGRFVVVFSNNKIVYSN
ncbi:MAG: hypothetical protein LBK43_07580 [Treponema sp.]|nr:hypothetical protein [Treponema sp.]